MNAFRWNTDPDTGVRRRLPPAGSPSTDEVLFILLSVGARLVAHQMHGEFLEVRRRLLFLRRTTAMAPAEIDDVLRTAAMDPRDFHEMIDELRTGMRHTPEVATPRR